MSDEVEEKRDEKRDEKHFNEQERANERGDAAEPDAPSRTESNAGMNTILSGGLGRGVQSNRRNYGGSE